MYWDDHLPPHFHAKYGEYRITVDILTSTLAISGRRGQLIQQTFPVLAGNNEGVRVWG